MAFCSPTARRSSLAAASADRSSTSTPTVLYFLGLPVARDMDGFARADLFRSTFTPNRPIAFVPSHNR